MEDKTSYSENGFTSKHLNDDLFKKVLSKVDPEAELLAWSTFDLNYSLANGVLSGGVKSATDRILGFVAFHLKYILPGSGQIYYKDVVLKSKPRPHELLPFLLKIYPQFQGELQNLLKIHFERFGLLKTDSIELQCVNLAALQAVTPEIYWSWMDEEQDIFVFVMEYLDARRFSHIDTAHDRNLWSISDITQVIHGLAKFHAAHFGINPSIPNGLCKDIRYMDENYILESEQRWRIFIKEAHKEEPEMWTESDYLRVCKFLDNIHIMREAFEKSPKTLIHFDCQPKNLCLRKEPTEGKHALCLYDWELACFGPPQIDLALFLMNVIGEHRERENWKHWVQVYLSQLRMELGSTESANLADHLEFDEFMNVFDMCMIERLINFYGTQLCLNHKYIQYGPYLRQAVDIGNSYLKSMCNIYNF